MLLEEKIGSMDEALQKYKTANEHNIKMMNKSLREEINVRECG